MKMLTRLLLVLVIIFVFGGLLGFLILKYNINPENIRAAQFLITVFSISFLVYTLTVVFRALFKNNRNLDEIMEESLYLALDSEVSPISAKVCASLLSFDKNKNITPSPCFLGLTNTRLLMVVANFMIIPKHILSFPLSEIKSCKLSKSLIPNQYILVLFYDEICIKIRLSLHVNNLMNQELNALILINELKKYS